MEGIFYDNVNNIISLKTQDIHSRQNSVPN
jgi:hypothetical protein